MENAVFTNKELAQAYWAVATQYAAWLSPIVSARNRIARCDVDLPSYYREHGNLEGVKGLGKGIGRTLELILKEGIEQAQRIVAEQRIESIQRTQFRYVPNRAPRAGEDGSPSWEDAVRKYET